MTFDWQTLWGEALTSFGDDPPGAGLEQHLFQSFCDHPQAVTNAVRKIAKAYAAGTIRSPWGALRAEIPRQIASDIHVGDGAERARSIAAAEQWIRNAGLMFDRWSEVEDELYRGYLEHWPNDVQLRHRMEELWNDLRPTGIRVEHEELERAAAWKATRASIDSLPKTNVPIAAPEAA